MVSFDSLLMEMMTISRESSTTDILLGKFSEKIRTAFSIDSFEMKELHGTRGGITRAEEFAINTGKPYIDNRLSDYSAFPELIKFSQAGYRSCLILPMGEQKKAFGVVTLLSKQEDKFNNSMIDTIGLLTNIVGYDMLVKAEKEKNLQIARYFDAAFNSIVPQVLIDATGTVIKANRGALAIFDKTLNQAAGKNIKDFFAGEVDLIGKLKNGLTLSAMRIDGSMSFELSSSRISNSLMHVVMYNTTELHELLEEQQLMQYSNNEAFMLLDKDTKVIWASKNADRIVKIQTDDLLSRKLSELVQGEKKMTDELAKIGNSLYTTSARLAVGNDVLVDTRLLIYKNSIGGFSCIVTNNNVDRYISAIQKLVEDVIYFSTDAIFTVDQFGNIEKLNKSAEKLFACKSEDIAGTPLSMLYADADSQGKMNSALSYAKKNGSIMSVFANMVSRGGSEAIPCEQSVVSNVDTNGNISTYTIVCKELKTKRAFDRLSDELAEAQNMTKELRSESDLKTQFIFNISHDLKTPITNIKGFSKLLMEGEFGKLNSEQEEYVKIVMDEAERLMQLIGQILDVAKLSSGKIKLDLQEVNFAKLGENPSIKTLQEVAEQKSLSFKWNIDYAVPEIKADPNRLIQVFVNLIGNALKFTESGSIVVNITKRGKSVRVEVVDTGVGISKEDKNKLFKKFFQIQKKGLTRQEGQGTGLGLSICKEIVSLHGGRIGVMSEAGRGSTFWFTIPIFEKKKKQKNGAQQSETHASPAAG